MWISRRFTCRRRWFVSCWYFYVSRPPPPHGCVFTHWLLVDASSTLKQGNVGAGITAVATELFPQCSEPEHLCIKKRGITNKFTTTLQTHMRILLLATQTQLSRMNLCFSGGVMTFSQKIRKKQTLGLSGARGSVVNLESRALQFPKQFINFAVHKNWRDMK